MRQYRLGLRTIIGLLLCWFASGVFAEQGTVSILAPWVSAGELFRVGPEQVLFLGVAEGIMYVEDKKTSSLNTATFTCPGTQQLNLKKGTTEGSGYCIFTGAGGDTVFAKWTCAGMPGGCEGKLTLKGGTGRFKGITGSGPMVVRTELVELVADLDTAEVVRGAAGLASWPKIKYKIPTQ